jgi:hypothetical protein
MALIFIPLNYLNLRNKNGITLQGKNCKRSHINVTGGSFADANLLYFSANGIHCFRCLFHRNCHSANKDIPATETSRHTTDFSGEKTNVAVGPSRHVLVSQRKTAQTGFMGFPDVFSRCAVASYYRASGAVGGV